MPRDRVLAEIRGLDLAAMEFGPDGFLPDDPRARSELLGDYGIAGIGGFVPVVLHEPDRDPLPALTQAAADFAAAGARVLVLAADYGQAGYDARSVLDDQAWTRLLENLDRAAAAAQERGLTAVLHPHVGTAVERPAEVQRVLDGSTIPLCLDTGHYFVGGGSPATLAAAVPDRIAHVHLKDVDAGLADMVRNGDLGYARAVRNGLFVRLGTGAAGIAETVRALEAAGYRGWYVIEQDLQLESEPPPGGGPAAEVRASLEFLAELPGVDGDQP
jgi:inosose dehydratase